MKTVKSLLLGSAAGLMAVAGAQAADLPVKAAPVEYVKICSLYGAGFYYIPGTDICVKFGGYVRGQYYANTGNSGTNGYFFTGSPGNQQTRLLNATNDFIFRTRTLITMDSRAQTEWGTVRTYMNIGWTQDSPGGSLAGNGQTFQGAGPSVYANRAFIQWAGFTFGKAQSFYDIFPRPRFSYFSPANSYSGDEGSNLAAYTAQWGNGITSTISVEEPRRFAITQTDCALATAPATCAGTNVWVVGAQLNSNMANVRYPDIVSNFRIDQAWGTFQIMSALHDASAAYYFSNCPVVGTTLTGAMNCGYPDDKWGWAAGVGGIFNLPFIAKGDTIAFQVNYAKGAARYINWDSTNGGANPSAFGGSYSLGLGFAQDAVVRDNIPGVQPGGIELISAWGAIAAYEHFWTQALHTSWYGGFIAFDYNATATSYVCDNILGAPPAGGIQPVVVNPLTGATTATRSTCTPNFGLWYAGTRTQWNIRPDFYMGVDVLYQHLDTAFAGFAAFNPVLGAPRPAGGTIGATNFPVYKVEDQDALSITFRVHRDIVP